MGYVFVMAPCLLCKQPFSFNPNFVPSIKVNSEGKSDPNGKREPICQTCHTRANEARKAAGVEPWPEPLPGAYEPANENSIDWGD